MALPHLPNIIITSQCTDSQGIEVDVTVEDVVKLVEDLSRVH